MAVRIIVATLLTSHLLAGSAFANDLTAISVKKEQCRAFLDIISLDGAEMLLQNAEYMNTLETCRKLLDPPSSDEPRSRKTGSETTATGTTTGTGTEGLLRPHRRNRLDLSRRNFRRKFKGNIDDYECKLEFFSRAHFQGNRTNLKRSVRRFRRGERSVRTFGPCCWKVFRRRNHRGTYSLLEPMEDFPSSRHYGMRVGSIRSVRKVAECPTPDFETTNEI